jgi:MFS family permease
MQRRVSLPQRQLIALYLTMVITRISFGIIIIIFPSYVLAANALTVAIALALYPAMEAISAVPLGRLCDVRGRKHVFLMSLSSMALLTGLIGFTRSVYIISLIHAFMGVAAAGITVSSLTMITDLTIAENRGAGMGFFDFANIGGYAIGLLAGGRLYKAFESTLGYAFFITAATLVLSFMVSFVLLGEQREQRYVADRTRSLNPLKALDARTKAILPLWLSITILIGIVFFLPKALVELGVRATLTSDLLFLGIVILGIGSVGFGALSDKLGREKTMLIGIVGLLGLLISLALLVGGTPSGSKFIQRWYLIGLFGLATSALVPSMLAAVGDRAKEHLRGSAMGLYSLMLSAGIATGNLVAGFADSYGGLLAILYVGAAIFIIACSISFVLLRRLERLSKVMTT